VRRPARAPSAHQLGLSRDPKNIPSTLNQSGFQAMFCVYLFDDQSMVPGRSLNGSSRLDLAWREFNRGSATCTMGWSLVVTLVLCFLYSQWPSHHSSWNSSSNALPTRISHMPRSWLTTQSAASQTSSP
jgi:hypothetical protein